MAGIRGGDDENSSSAVEVHVLDPCNGDQWVQFDSFNSNYELAGARWKNNVYRK